MDEIDEIAKNLVAHKSQLQQRTYAIRGASGMGKTQLALEFAHRYATSFRLVAWIRASSIASLRGDFSLIAAKIFPSHSNGSDQRKDIALPMEWLDNGKPNSFGRRIVLTN